MLKKSKKTIALLIVSSMLMVNLFFLPAPTAHAIPTVDPGTAATAAGVWAQFAKYVLKEFVLDLAARLIARSQLSNALKGIANQVIRSGRTGRTPAFIQNWRNLQLEGQYRGEDVFRTIIGNTAQCPYFRNEILNTFGVKNVTALQTNTQLTRVNNLDPYTLRGRCTLPQAWSINNYRRDFSGNGGWDALVRLSQPQNNFYGSLLLSLRELDAQRGIDSSADIFEAGAGSGYLGVRQDARTQNSCASAPIVGYCSNGLGACSTDQECTSVGPLPDNTLPSKGFCVDKKSVPSQARCTFLGNVSTPGDILGQGAAEFIDSNLKWLTTSDEISEVLGNFIQAMLTKLTNYSADTIAGKISDPQQDRLNACVKQCDNTSSGSQRIVCYDRCYKSAGVDSPSDYNNFAISPSQPPPPPPPPPPPAPAPLPDSTVAITACNDGTQTPTTSNVCLAAQWFRAGVAGAVDPTGQCATSNCVILNYNIWDGSGGADIYRDSAAIISLPVSLPDYPNGTRVDVCNGDGNISYGLATLLTPGFNLALNIPIGGSGTCP